MSEVTFGRSRPHYPLQLTETGIRHVQSKQQLCITTRQFIGRLHDYDSIMTGFMVICVNTLSLESEIRKELEEDS